MKALIQDTLRKLLADQCQSQVVEAAEAGVWPEKLWQTLQETGLTLAGLKAELGGAGGEPADALLVMREAARFAAPVPLAEHLLAALLLQEAGEPLAAPCATLAVGEFRLDGKRLSGSAEQVAFARWCSHLLVPADSAGGKRLCLLPREACALKERQNLAGEPRDGVKVDAATPSQVCAAPPQVAERIQLLGAASRTVMMSGALESILEMSVAYAMERVQFGRPLARFQAIQQQLAVLAGEVAAATMAAQAVEAAFASLDEVEIAIGKARVGEAVAPATDIAHQVHGAMGYTQEHPLNHRSRRLWAWRDEYGAEPHWQALAGRALMQGGAEALWPKITARS